MPGDSELHDSPTEAWRPQPHVGFFAAVDRRMARRQVQMSAGVLAVLVMAIVASAFAIGPDASAGAPHSAMIAALRGASVDRASTAGQVESRS